MAFGTGEEDLGKIAIEQRQHDFRFGIAEANVELDNARATVGDHDSDVEDATINPSLIAQAFERRLDDLALDLLDNLRRYDRSRSIRAHTAGVLAAVAI